MNKPPKGVSKSISVQSRDTSQLIVDPLEALDYADHLPATRFTEQRRYGWRVVPPTVNALSRGAS
jgi:hypothetical protein